MSDEKSTYLTFPFSISYILYDGNRGIDNLWHRTRSFNIATKLKHDYPHLNLYAECKSFNDRCFKITTHKSHFEVLLTFLSMEYYDVQSAINEWHQDKIINNNNFSVVYGKFIYICTVENDDVIILSRSISNEKKRHKNYKRLRGLFGAELPSDRLPILSGLNTKEVSGGITTTNGLSCKNKTCKGKRYNTKNSGIAQYSAQRATNFNPINEHKGYKKHHSRSLGDDFLTLMGLNGENTDKSIFEHFEPNDIYYRNDDVFSRLPEYDRFHIVSPMDDLSDLNSTHWKSPIYLHADLSNPQVRKLMAHKYQFGQLVSDTTNNQLVIYGIFYQKANTERYQEGLYYECFCIGQDICLFIPEEHLKPVPDGIKVGDTAVLKSKIDGRYYCVYITDIDKNGLAHFGSFDNEFGTHHIYDIHKYNLVRTNGEMFIFDKPTFNIGDVLISNKQEITISGCKSEYYKSIIYSKTYPTFRDIYGLNTPQGFTTSDKWVYNLDIEDLKENVLIIQKADVIIDNMVKRLDKYYQVYYNDNNEKLDYSNFVDDIKFLLDSISKCEDIWLEYERKVYGDDDISDYYFTDIEEIIDSMFYAIDSENKKGKTNTFEHKLKVLERVVEHPMQYLLITNLNHL